MFKQELILAIALFFNNNFTTSIVYKQKKSSFVFQIESFILFVSYNASVVAMGDWFFRGGHTIFSLLMAPVADI